MGKLVTVAVGTYLRIKHAERESDIKRQIKWSACPCRC